ncbi:MAG: hypothetical protein AAF684_00960 [Pseudomonadota bacterium]
MSDLQHIVDALISRLNADGAVPIDMDGYVATDLEGAPHIILRAREAALASVDILRMFDGMPVSVERRKLHFAA